VAFEIPLAEIGAEGVEAEDPVVIAARADLFVLESDRQEGAWAAGTRFTERGDWATYFTYTVEEAPPCGGEDSKCVFVTSTIYNGNLGGLSGADAACQVRAQAESSLAAPGTYKLGSATGSIPRPAAGSLNHQYHTGSSTARRLPRSGQTLSTEASKPPLTEMRQASSSRPSRSGRTPQSTAHQHLPLLLVTVCPGRRAL
jgi:hypothetical protein